jgi:hypothetical protein
MSSSDGRSSVRQRMKKQPGTLQQPGLSLRQSSQTQRATRWTSGSPLMGCSQPEQTWGAGLYTTAQDASHGPADQAKTDGYGFASPRYPQPLSVRPSRACRYEHAAYDSSRCFLSGVGVTGNGLGGGGTDGWENLAEDCAGEQRRDRVAHLLKLFRARPSPGVIGRERLQHCRLVNPEPHRLALFDHSDLYATVCFVWIPRDVVHLISEEQSSCWLVDAA